MFRVLVLRLRGWGSGIRVQVYMVNMWAGKLVNGKSMGPYKYPPLTYMDPLGFFIAIQQWFLQGRLSH